MHEAMLYKSGITQLKRKNAVRLEAWHQSMKKIFQTLGGEPLQVAIIVDLLVIGICYLPYFILKTLPPLERLFSVTDSAISFPFTEKEKISSSILPLFTTMIPLAILTGCIVCNKPRNRRLLCVFVGWAFAMMVTMNVTVLAKATVGRLRPDFLARCQPRMDDRMKFVCLGDEKSVMEGRRSFPSGHTSYSFAGLGYTGFVLAGQLGVFSGRGAAYKLLIVLLPFLLASYVGLTRVTDYRHHWEDVLSAAVLGIVMAYLSYRVHFPSIMCSVQIVEPARPRHSSNEAIDGSNSV